MKLPLELTFTELQQELDGILAKYSHKQGKSKNLLLAKLLYWLTFFNKEVTLQVFKNTALALECLRQALKQQQKKSHLQNTILISDCLYAEAMAKVVITNEPFIVKKLAEAISEVAVKRLTTDNSLKPLVATVFDLAAYFSKKEKTVSQDVLKLKKSYLNGKIKLADLVNHLSLEPFSVKQCPPFSSSEVSYEN